MCIVSAVWERPPVNFSKFVRFKPVGVEHIETRHDDRPPPVLKDHFSGFSIRFKSVSKRQLVDMTTSAYRSDTEVLCLRQFQLYTSARETSGKIF